MYFTLDVIRARKGDCLMLHYGSANKPRHIMIDGGPKNVYKPHLKPRLQQIRTARGIANNKPLPIDLLMVSHVDDDHIQGILELTHEMIEADQAHKPQLVQVLDLWHNSFENIIGDTPDKLTAAFKSQFGAASVGGEPPDDLTVEVEDEDEETVVSSIKVFASIEQGAQLRSDAEALNFPLNEEFGGDLIIAQTGSKAVEIGPGLKFTVVGPMLPEIKELHKKHQQWLIDLQKEGKTPHDVLSAYVDKSVPNLSSIVVLAEAGGKRILFTGDARGDKILEGLELVGLVKKGESIHVDILKVPHHGSSNNLDNDFFERITAEHYIFSGDGEHGNPERDSLLMLMKAREGADYTVHLTYPIDEIDKLRKEDWEKEQGKEKKRKESRPNAKVRPNWSPQKNSLATFLDENEDFAKKLSIVSDAEPHVINLLDKIKF